MQLETTPGTGSLKSLQPEYPERQRSRLQQIMKELLSDEGELIKYRDIAREIRKQDVELMNCSDADLQERFSKLKKRCQKAQPSELLMVEAYALITEVIRRQKGITMSDVQLMAAAAMGSNDGAIGEMKTGEGKTLTLAMVLFYRALFPHKSMLFTTNDYLAIDGAMNMGSLFSFFGMKVGVIVSGESDPATKTFIYQPSAADDSRQAILTSASKQEVYQLADVIYASGSEVLFDYAREQFSPSLGSSEFPFQEQLFARFLAIDEMDVFLAELALVPHIISVELSKDVISQSFDEKSLAKYQQLFVNLFLSPERINSLFEIDQVRQSAEFTEDGIAQLDELVDETLIECVQAGNLHLPASFHVDSLNEQLAQYLKAKKDQNQEVFHDQIQKNDYWLFFEQLRADLYGYAQTVLYCHYFLIEDINYFVEDVDGRKKIVVLLEDNRPGRDRRYQNWVQVVLHIREQIDVPTPQATQNRQSVPLFIQRFPQWCGITGTASEISKEMASIYGKTVVSIPTRLEDLIATGQVSLRRIDDIKGPEYQDPDNKTYYVRQDFTDSVHPNEQEKRRAIVCDAIEYASMGRPVLINAVSNAQARDLYQALKSAGYNQIQLVVSTEADLNAQERMAYAQAGRSGTITIVAKLAGRGVDIKLGGDPILTAQIKIAEKESAGIKLSASEKETIIEKCQNECLADAQRARNAGGLHVIGVEHGRGRDDRQLMGRAARQGDPGSSQFYYSPDDQWALEHSVQRELDQAHHRWWERLVRRVFLSEKRRQARQEATHDRVIARIQKDVELRESLIRLNQMKNEILIERVRQLVKELKDRIFFEANPIIALQRLIVAVIDQRVAQIMSKEDGTNVEVKNNLNIGLALTIDPFIKIILSSESHKQVIQEILELNDLEETNVRNRCTVLCLKGESMKVAAAVIEALKDEVDNYINQFLSMMAFFQQGFITMLDQLLGVVSTVPGLSEAQMSDKEKISLLRKIYSELIRQIQESGLQNISFVPDGEMETWDVDKLSSELQTMIKELKTEAHKDPLIDLRNVFIQQIRYLRQQNIGEELPIPTEEEIATYDQGELILRYKEFRQQVDLRDIITKLMINSLETEWQFFLTGVIEKSIEEARTKAFLTRTDADTLVVSEVFQAFDELQKSFLNTVILNLLTKWGYFTAITSRVYLEAFLINDQTRDAVTTFFPTISLD